MTALLQGLFIGIGFAIVGLPSPVVFGVLAALLSLLPVGGSALVWVPAVIWLFIEKHWGWGIFLLVWGSALSGLDNVVRPLLISGPGAHFRPGGIRRRIGRYSGVRGHRRHRGPRSAFPGAGTH